MVALDCLESSKWASSLSGFIMEQTFRACSFLFFLGRVVGRDSNTDVWDISKALGTKSIFQGIRVVWASPVKYS